MKVSHVRKLDAKHRYIMYLIRRVANRVQGMGLKVVKFHAILHLMEDILLNGVPLEMDTSANEEHHKPSKHAAKLTQMAHTTFNIQTARRLHEFKLIALAILEIKEGKVLWEYFDGFMNELFPDMQVQFHPNQRSEDVDMATAPEAEPELEVVTGGGRISVGCEEDAGSPGSDFTPGPKKLPTPSGVMRW